MKLEAVSGLSQQALIIDVAAKVLADNLTSLTCAAAPHPTSLPRGEDPTQDLEKDGSEAIERCLLAHSPCFGVA